MSGEIEIVTPSAEEMAAWPKRADGSQKGQGFFGLMKRPDGQVSSELSIGVDLGNGETEIPLLVPTLTRGEIDHLLSGGKPTEDMVQKAVEHATGRIGEGRSPFAVEGEQLQVPRDAEQDFRSGFQSRAPLGVRSSVNTKMPAERPTPPLPASLIGGARG